MTVTVVLGKTSDGYLQAYYTTHSGALTGPATSIGGGNISYAGQNNNGGYQIFQAVIGFDYAAIPSTERVTHAAVRLNVAAVYTPAIARDLEFLDYTWSTGSLITADWRTPSQLNALTPQGLVHITDAAAGKWILASSDALITEVSNSTVIEQMVVTSRQRNQVSPSQDEAVAFYSADAAGTTADPQLIYTTTPRSTLYGVTGAQVQLSTGGWAYLESNGAITPAITLKYRSPAAVVTTIGTIPLGTAATSFDYPRGLQSFALVTDPSDNLFVIGKSGAAANTLAARAYVKGGGTTWTAGTLRTAAMPTYGEGLNQVVAAYHANNSGTIFFAAAHVGSAGDNLVHNEMCNGTLDVPYLLTGTGSSMLRASGYTVPTLLPNASNSSYFNTWANETGTGMDVAAALQAGGSMIWGYLLAGPVSAAVADNLTAVEARYILTGTGGGFSHTSSQTLSIKTRKDASSKVRAIPVSATAVAFVTTNHDAGHGISVNVRNHSGTDSGSVSIGYWASGGEITGMPDGPAIGSSPNWDAVYNSTENSLWVYYVDTVASPAQIRRTMYDLDTMMPRQNSVLVTTLSASDVVLGIRVQRNAPVTQQTQVSIAWRNGSTYSTTYVTDIFNIAPTAPVLIPEPNFDATVTQTFEWTFTDPNPGDTQSAYQLEISRVSDGVVVLDTGKVVSTTPSRSVAGSTVTNGNDYRWRVRTWDALDLESPWSTDGTFSTTAGGNVTITSPATDYPASLITDDLPISWSTTGTTQAAYRVWLYRGATLVSDTNWIASVATTHTVTGMLTDQTHEIRVQVRNGAAVPTNTASRFVTPSYATPEQPSITVAGYPDDGYMLITVNNPAPGAPVIGTAEEDFETSLGTWTGYSVNTPAPGILTRDSTYAHHGTWSARLTASAGGLAQIYARDATPTPVLAGVRYTARMWVRTSRARNVAAAIDWYDGSSAYLTTSILGVDVPAETWVRIEVTGTAPSNGFAAYGPTITTTVNAEYVNFDEVVLTIASDRPEVAENEILRRVSGSTGSWEVIGYADVDGEFRDYTATALTTYEYRARGQS